MSEYKALSAFEQVELQERIAHLETLAALQAEALKGVISIADRATQEFDAAKAAISASAEAVQAFRDKLTEPLRAHLEEANSLANMQDIAIEQLRREVAMLRNSADVLLHDLALYQVGEPLEELFNDGGLLRAAINNTQSTAQAYEQKMKREGAVEALEDMAETASNLTNTSWLTKEAWAAMCYAEAARLRATSKKAG